MTFYRFRMHAPLLDGSYSAMRRAKPADQRQSGARVTKVGFYSFAAAEDDAVSSRPQGRSANGWESTARLLRVLASAGHVPIVGHA